MKLFLCALLLGIGCGHAATFRTFSPTNETPGQQIPGTSLYWPQPSVLSLQMSNVVEVLALTVSPTVVTNWTRSGVIRNGTTFPVIGRIIVREEGTYLLAFRYSGASDAARNVLAEIFVNGSGTGIRSVQSHGVGSTQSISLVGLKGLQVDDIITVRLSCLAGAANLSISEAGLNVVQLFD